MAITLLNADATSVVYAARQISGNAARFTGPSVSLLGKPSIDLQLNEKANTNRVVGKLSIPTVKDAADPAKVPFVGYTEVGSFDLAAVKFASATDAENFYAQFVSLVQSEAVRNMFLSGTIPA